VIWTGILLLAFVFFTFLGYVVHRVFHQSWAGVFYRAHCNHHNQQYPPGDLVSDVYRHAGSDNSFRWFLLAFSPLILGAVALTVAGVVPIIVGVGLLVEMGIVAWLNDAIHDGTHITRSVWHRFRFFDRLQRLHFQHHLDQGTNYSIWWFVWDRVFGTYRE
jgi:sterol desaturase/sphingolipid hydroxylase (fatty acid hydroxylase superfamily)